MSKLIIPADYKPALNLKQTEQAIKNIKDFFLQSLSTELRLRRVTAPLFVLKGLGMNDDLNGVERAVNFPIKDMQEARAEVVHSLAKWKRNTLAEYSIEEGFGIVTDMNAIRADEELDNTHSLYVDQWDWERVMRKEDRNVKFLKKIVRKIYSAILRTEFYICETYPTIKPAGSSSDYKPVSDDFTREWHELLAGGPYFTNDDWTTENEEGYLGLNGDLLVWYPVLGAAMELSSMGIRVDAEALLRQLKLTNKEERVSLYFHHRLLEGELPLSIGGGIGQSRLCMILLHKAHIGETQSSIWPSEMRSTCAQAGIPLI